MTQQIKKEAEDFADKYQKKEGRSYFAARDGYLAALQRHPPGEWVKCEERLPEPTQRVLAFHKSFNVIITNNYRNGEWQECVNGYNDDVTHWAELPAPPSDNTQTPIT